MPKPNIGDIKVTKKNGHRLEVWVGSRWKGIALDSHNAKNPLKEIRKKGANTIFLEDALLNPKSETVDCGVELDKTEISNTALITVANIPDANYEWLNLDQPIYAGQIKIITFGSKSALGPNSLKIYSKFFFSSTTVLTTSQLGRTAMLIAIDIDSALWWMPIGDLSGNWTIS